MEKKSGLQTAVFERFRVAGISGPVGDFVITEDGDFVITEDGTLVTFGEDE